jgi:cytochrome c-type biogenesis protein CcmH
MKAMLLWLMLLAAPAFAVGVDANMLPDPAAEQRARALMQELRCLVCQNQSISDSDAPLAQDLRAIVRERIAAGDSNVEIKAYLTARYGDWVLLNPPLNAGTILLWGGPLVGLLLGIALIMRHAWRPATDISPLTDEEQKALERLP